MQVSILSGGTTERPDSLISGKAVAAMLQAAGHCPEMYVLDDFARPALEAIPRQPTIIMLHGGFGEGGQLQGYLEMAGVPFSGSRSLPSALALDKWYSKRLFQEARVPVPSARIVCNAQQAEASARELGFPIVAKPVNGGSSQGVTLIPDKPRLLDWMAAHPPCPWLLETFVAGRNVTVAILEHKTGLRCFRPLQILLDADTALYDEQAKTTRQRRYSLFDSSESRLEQQIADLAVTCHTTLGCFGTTRVDFIVDPQDRPLVLEANTVPGMSENGNYRTAYRMSDVSDAEFCDLLLASIV